MGWHASSDPRRREVDIRRNEADSYKQVSPVLTRDENEPSRSMKSHNHREGPYKDLLLVESDYNYFHI